MPTSSAPEASQQAPVTPGSELGPRRARRAALAAPSSGPTAAAARLDPTPVVVTGSAGAAGQRRGRRRADAVVDALPATAPQAPPVPAAAPVRPAAAAAPAPVRPAAPSAEPRVLVLPETPVVVRALPSRRELRGAATAPTTATAPTAGAPVTAALATAPAPSTIPAPRTAPATNDPAAGSGVGAPTTTGSVVRVPRGVVRTAGGRGAGTAFAPDRGRRTHRETTRSAFGLPQIGVVGVLGLVTMITPVIGQLASAEADTGTTTTTSAAAVSDGVGAALSLAPVAAQLTSATGETSSVTTGADAGELDATELEARLEAAQQASRDIGERTLEQQAEAAVAAQAAELTAGCTGAVPEELLDAENGRLDTSELCSLWQPGMMLRADAAVALARLDLAYRAEFGEDIVLSDAYRTYDSQVRLRASKPGLAARPGTSEHGWGLAVDLGGGVQNSDEHYDWLAEHAPAYGWSNPDWALSGGSGPFEPWHWEFGAGSTARDTTE